MIETIATLGTGNPFDSVILNAASQPANGADGAL